MMQKTNSLNYEISSNEKAIYSYWRKSIFISIFISWGTFHFARKCFSAIIPCLKSDLGLSIAQIGFLSTAFYIAYSVSKIFSGYLSDHSNARYLISFSLIIAGITNIVFGTSNSIYTMSFCLIISAFFQACAWPACTKLLTFWCRNSERGKWWGLCGMGQNLGAGLIPIVAGFISIYLSWRWAMYLSGFFSVLIGISMTATVRDVPASLGLPPIEKPLVHEHLTDTKASFILVMKKHILTNIPLLIFSISGLFLYIIRTAVNDWVPLYLMEAKQYTSLILANSTIWWFEVGGILGSVAACWASDVLFKSNRLLASIFFSCALFVSVILFYKVPAGYIIVDDFALGIIGFLMFGIQTVFGLATSEMVIKTYAGTANSFGGSICSIGAAIAGFPLALVVENYGWDGFFYSISFCCLLTLALIIVTQFAALKKKVNTNSNILAPA